MHRWFYNTILSALILASSVFAGEVLTYPAPKGAKLSADYEVWVNDIKLDIYNAETIRKGPYGHSYDFGGDYSFTYFTMPKAAAENVLIRIVSKNRSMKNVVIRPLSQKVTPQHIDDQTIHVSLKKAQKVVIEPDGIKAPLVIFANATPDKVYTESSKNVIYYGPGLHKPEKIELKDNQTLYLAGGAVVKAGLLIKGDNVTVCGPGILDGSDWPWAKGPVGHGFINAFGNHLTLKDFIILGSPNWTIKLNNIHHVRIQNLKLCNARVQNDDGVDICNSQRVLIEDCFMRCDDDCIAIKGMAYRNPKNRDTGVSRVLIKNCIFWCDRARIALIGHESQARHMQQITFDNIDIIHFAMTPLLLEPGEEMYLRDIKFRNIRLHGEGQSEIIRIRPMVNQYMKKKVPGYARNVTFDGITVYGKSGGYKLTFQGADRKHNIADVIVKRTTTNGNKINRKDSPYIQTNKHLRGLSVQ